MSNKLNVCVQTSCWYSVMNNDRNYVDQCVKFIKECGFDGVDFNIDHALPGSKIKSGELTDFFDKSTEEILEFFTPFKEACEKHGISVEQMHAPFPAYVEDNDEVNDYLITAMEKSFAVAHFLNCKAVVVHPASLDDKEKEKQVNLERYRRLIPAAKKYGVIICLENMFRTLRGQKVEGACSTAEETVWYVDKLNEEAGEKVFGYCFDIGHATLLKRDIYQFIKALDDRLTILHIHDNNGDGDFHLAPFTQRTFKENYTSTDWDAFIKGLKEIGYTGPLSFETFNALVLSPKPLHEPMLRFIAETGKYFKEQIENQRGKNE